MCCQLHSNAISVGLSISSVEKQVLFHPVIDFCWHIFDRSTWILCGQERNPQLQIPCDNLEKAES